MPAPITIRVVTSGVAQVKEALRSVSQAMEDSERRSTRAAQGASNDRIRVSRNEGSTREKLFQQLAREAGRWQKDETRAAEREAKERTRASQKEATEKEKVAASVARSAERAQKDETRAVEDAARNRDRIRERSALMAGQWAKREADNEIREAKRVSDARGEYAGRMLGVAGHSVGSALRGITSVGRGVVDGVLQVGGGFSLADSVSREVNLTKMAANISASSQAGANGKRTSTSEILNTARSIGNAQAMDPEEVVAAIGRFKDLTGNVQQGMAIAPQIAKMATAFGGKPSDLMENAANVAMYNPTMSNEDILKFARVQTKQGMVGGIELKEGAKYGSRIVASAANFGGDRATNMATMGALAQVARQHGGATTAAEATMASARFATDIVKGQKRIEAAGVHVRNKDGTIRNANDIIGDMLTKSGGDVFKMQSMFKLGERSSKVLSGMGALYREGGGGAKGLANVRGELDKFTTGVSESDMEDRNKQRLSEVDAQLTIVMNELKDAAGKELLPELIKMIPVIRDSIPMFTRILQEGTKLAEWFVNNPIKGIGAVILAAIAKDLAAAMIGDAVKNLLTKAIAGSAGGGPIPGALGGGKGMPGAGTPNGMSAGQGLSVMAGVTMIATATADVVDTASGGYDKGGARAKELLGANSPAALAKAKKDADEKGGIVGGIKGAAGVGTILSSSMAGPMVYGANYASNKITQAITGKEDANHTNTSSFFDALGFKKALSDATMAGIQDGQKRAQEAGSPASGDAAHRNVPMSAPARGGAQ